MKARAAFGPTLLIAAVTFAQVAALKTGGIGKWSTSYPAFFEGESLKIRDVIKHIEKNGWTLRAHSRQSQAVQAPLQAWASHHT